MNCGESKVLYIAMPFASVAWGSLGLGTLKAIGESRGIASDVRYLNIPFARRLGPAQYKAIGELFDAEVVFTATLFPDVAAEAVWEGYLEHYRRGSGDAERFPAARENFLRIAAEHAPQLIAAALKEIPWDDYDIIGFTTGFHQTVSSLALARSIRERFPQKILLFGGAGCEGEIGPTLLRHFEFLDVVVSGEADTQIVPLVEALRQGLPVNRWPGVYARAGDRVAVDAAGPSIGPALYGRPWTDADAGQKVDLATLPVPDYEDYFAQIAGLELGEDIRIPFESSRGCWWGQKRLCTFCGLNGTSLAYRAKPADRVLGEIATLYARHAQRRFMATDNILDMRFLQTLLPGFRELHQAFGIEFFYEVKSNLRTDQVRWLRESAITEIQPGIESFSDHVLELMDKGTTGLNQVRFLRDCDAVALTARYGILWGNPGETAADYAALRRRLPFIRHLTPPKYVQPIALERFSPYFLAPERFGIRNLRADDIYRVAFGYRDLDFDGLAYVFSYDHDFKRDRALRAERDRFLDETEAWQAGYRPRSLIMAEMEGVLYIADRRDEEMAVYRLEGADRSLFLACESPRAEASLCREHPELATEQIRAFLARLIERRLLLEWPGEIRKLLALPVRTSPEVFYHEVLAPREPMRCAV